jgi:hypothetical protein
MSSADQLHVLYLALSGALVRSLRLFFLNFEKVIPLKSAVCHVVYHAVGGHNVVARTHYVLLFYIIM